ncbi:hypothetical protein [Microbacterium maritypicum]|uniref:hypothetical protein n=1 Tax=Microbacterium maritypicum TaxID=33918 RepID=UPI00381883AC
MSTEKSDRPAALKRVPRPAADNGVDPVDVVPAVKPASTPAPAAAPAAPTASTTPAPTKARREPTIPLSTRVALDVTEILDAAVAEGRAPSQRAAIEMAIRQTWGKPNS